MKRKILYSKKNLLLFRLFSIACAALLCFILLQDIFVQYLYDDSGHIVLDRICWFLLNTVVMIGFIIVAILPQHFALTGVFALIYAIDIIPFEPSNAMGNLMYFLAIKVLLLRGFSQKHAKVKMVIVSGLYIALILSKIRFGFTEFIFNYLLEDFAITVILCVILFFTKGEPVSEEAQKSLNLARFKGLNSRDCLCLKKVQEGKKYSVIAREVNLAEGSLRNRLKKIYEIMEVGDRQGFLSYYTGWTLFFNDEILNNPPPPPVDLSEELVAKEDAELLTQKAPPCAF